MTVPTINVAIIGAGPSGLVLARLLHQHSLSPSPSGLPIKFTIFESEPSPTSRSQGGTLDLRSSTGLAAISACGLKEKFLQLARWDGEAMKICDQRGRVWFKVEGGKKGGERKGARPEIDRIQLRQLLLDSVPVECLKWGKKLSKVTQDAGSGDLRMEFEDGQEVGGFDLIVGADGCWSKTRAFLTDEHPVYAGVCGIEQHISNAEEKFPDIYRMVNRGSLYNFGGGNNLSAQQIGDGSIKIADWGVRDVNWAKEHDAAKMEPSAIKALLQEAYKDWAPEFRKLLGSVDEEGAVTRSLFMLPIGLRWENKPGVTVIGDAAHVMVPFAGEGANLSMADAMYLAQWIQKSTDKASLYENVAKFEEEMFVRMKPVQQISYDNMRDMFFTEGAPRTTIESYLTRMVKHMEGPVIGTLAGAGIYTFYWAIKLVR
jgi:2-polyprenyl-6-methoxyphenol hydroxylase-like FAD-dependent oxidoreductase